MPLHDPSPYEVLGIPPTAGVREINVAVGPATRAARFTRQQIQEAAALLRNPDRRLELDLQQPLPPGPADGTLDLLAPMLERPLLVIDRPPLPSASSLLTLRRADLEADFADLDPASPDDEPAIPARFTAGISVLPMIEFP
jgi:curved DNA-binding protein CbpA